MFSRYLLPLAVIAATFCYPELASAQNMQPRSAYVCWADSTMRYSCPPNYRAYHIPCGTGGSLGFDVHVVCPMICGTQYAPGVCQVYPAA